MFVVGIDPGKNGALAVCNLSTDHTDYYKLPETQEETWMLWNGYKDKTSLVVVERISPRIEQGVRRITTSCVRFGWLQMMLLTPDRTWEVSFVTPAQWYKSLAMTKRWPRGYTEEQRYKERKAFNKLKATERFPELKVTHTNADALLICAYAKKIFNKPIRKTNEN